MQQQFTFNDHTLTVELAPPGTDEMLFDDGELTGVAFDHTGLGRVWPASVVLCRWLAGHPADVEGRRVLELGAGTGLPSLLCATKLNAQHVVATDATQAVVDRLRAALAGAGAACRHEALCLPWEDSELLLAAAGTIDTVLLADVIYPMKEQAPLLTALRGLLVTKPDITILLASTARDPKLHANLEQRLRALPRVQLELLCNESERDPLYGNAMVYVYRLRSSV